MGRAVIVSAARTGIGKAYRGALNDTHGAMPGAHALRHAALRAGLEADDVDDVAIGCAQPEGAQKLQIGHHVAMRAGLPASVPGYSVNRYCASGLQAIADGVRQIAAADAKIVVADGVETTSLVQNDHMNLYRSRDPWLEDNRLAIYLPMVETAEIVPSCYKVSRDAQDEYAAASQMRVAEGLARGAFDIEIVAMDVNKTTMNAETGERKFELVTLVRDEGPRPTTLEGLARLKPVLGDRGTVTAGNASQLSDGAAALVLMDEREASRRGLQSLGALVGMAVAGCEPDEMGVRPVHAVPKLLQRHGLTIGDIGSWELNEVFASQVIYCRDRLGIPGDRLNVDGGAISMGHPYGMTGARMAAHALFAGKARNIRHAIVTMCIGGGMGAAELLEIH